MRHIADSIIYLTGFISTVLFLFCSIYYSSNKSWFIWILFGGIVFGLLTGFLIWQNEIWKDSASIVEVKQNVVEPKMSFRMEYPIKVENEKPYRDTNNPTIILTNAGPISAVSVTVKIDIYVFNTKENKIVQLIKTGFEDLGYSLSSKELEPFSDLKESTIGINGKDIIAIYSVTASYYRKSDMKSFDLNGYFFTVDKTIYSESEFKSDDRFQIITDKIKSFTPPDVKDSEVTFTAAAEHIWFMESSPAIFKRKNSDGSVTIVGPPEKQNDSPVSGLPHLVISPSRFDGNNQFVALVLGRDHINAKVRYEVRNIGEDTAIITQDGFDPVVEIEPGQKKYYISPFKIVENPNNNSSLQEFIEAFNANKQSIKLRLNLLYRLQNDQSKLFKITTSNEFGKNNYK